MNALDVQTVVLRTPEGRAVAHLIVCIPAGAGRQAAQLIETHATSLPSFGPRGASSTCCSIGFSFAGLEALCVPEAYLRLFRNLAPAFTAGAVRRSPHLGDSGASAAPNWQCQFRQDRAHVVLSWHGEPATVRQRAKDFAAVWDKAFGQRLTDDRLAISTDEHVVIVGERLGHPAGQTGEWVHFGYRDGISEVSIDDELPRPTAPDLRHHAPGTLLLGDINDAGFNDFALSLAPGKVRAFFRDSSFGILRPMAQDLEKFETQVDRWVAELGRIYDKPVTRNFVKAKLCGRWPDGKQPRPGDLTALGSLVLDLRGDENGEGCPFGSHVRRMRASPDRYGNVFERPLQRRSMPFGSANWSERPGDDVARGHIGHFFCASIEDQFEHLLGQWAARPPLGFPADDRALDPLSGPHEDREAALLVPLKGKPDQMLRGFGAWTTTLGTMYAWHPGRCGLTALLKDQFVPEEDERPWL